MLFLSGSGSSDPNVSYLSGFSAPDPFLFLRTKTGGILLLSPLEKGRALRLAGPGIEVLTPAEIGLSGNRAAKLENQALALLARAGKKSVAVPSDFPAGLFLALRKKGVRISVSRKPPCPERAIKRPEEIAAIRAAQRAAVAAVKAAKGMLAAAAPDANGTLRLDGEALSSERLRETIVSVLTRHGCAAPETIVAGGEQAVDPHERGHGPLRAGEAIVLDVFPRNERTGYWGDLTRTFCRGPAPEPLKRLHRAVKAAQTAALNTLRAGVPAADVHAAAVAEFERRGYRTGTQDGRPAGFIHGTGHGVGLDVHEAPRLGTGPERLRAGHVVTVEPGLYYPGLGGVRIEDTVLVTQTGFRMLAPCGKTFEIRP